MTAITSTVDYTAIKARQRDTWASGDYAVIGTTLQIVGESLSEAVDVQAGERVLDVAAGNGNASLAAARRGADVTAADYVTSLLDRAQARAASEGLVIATERADAEALPFPDGSFDVVLSTFGVMFAPNQEQAAAELVRACRPGGRIGLANWTPSGFIGQMFKTVGRYVPAARGSSSSGRVGRRGSPAGALRRRRRIPRRPTPPVRLPLPLGGGLVETFRTYYGPTLKAFSAVEDAAGRLSSGTCWLSPTSGTPR